MSATTQPTTFSDLYTDLQNRVRIQTGKTATENQAKRYINTALYDFHVGNAEKLPWTERHAILVTQPEYTTGTVTIVKGSATLAGTSTAWNTNNAFGVANMRAGGKVVIDGKEEVYEVSSVTSDTVAALTSAFVEDDVSGASYAYFEDEYDLAADFWRPMDAQFFDQKASISIINRREFRLRYPRNKVTGKPLVATIHDRDFTSSTTPRRRITFWKPPDSAFMLPYNYITRYYGVTSAGVEQEGLSSDTDEPIIPIQYRHVLVLHGLIQWYRDKKNDTRSQEVKAEYVDLVNRIIADQEIGRSTPQIRVRTQIYKSKSRRPYSGKGSRFVTGSAFDEVR